ncbi:MAG: hypothetical protein A3G03_01335 [Candidatus Taylorbacteria bacterium RIFCSPLOWO2_12_FULL_44_15c]|uniref:N-acetyltransferase domain-containing protein n=1 Tax=Candidatus Taylorbacteria bacterium RIFCSPLOWO2_12_FULL_44_15c TaxID=1802333 RepID=A0A1G2P582_9BACT|nr:MAG: hypothetical protein A3G03_01335 [Candidatus Taylorbacteria bacterium RIFCSPLOWO2_12_FULL_44_15c]
MEKFEQPKQERQESAEVKILSLNGVDQAIECFADAIARDWPNSKEEATNWVFDEFHNPDSTILGVYDKDNLAGACSLVPLNFVLERTSENEHQLVLVALNQELKIDLSKAIYVGGFSVKREYEGQGIARQLFTFVDNFAINNGYEAIVAHTARPSEKYQKIQALPIALSRYKMRELLLPHKIFYPSPDDLEKVWLYKLLK